MRSKRHITVRNINFDEAQEKFLELKFNSAAKDKLKVLDLEAFRVLSRLISYFCESPTISCESGSQEDKNKDT